MHAPSYVVRPLKTPEAVFGSPRFLSLPWVGSFRSRAEERGAPISAWHAPVPISCRGAALNLRSGCLGCRSGEASLLYLEK